jgi:hypothetical protein
MRAKVVENTHFFVVKQRHHADVDARLVEVDECLRRCGQHSERVGVG